MPVDTSFYPTKQATPMNPLETMQGYANVQSTMGQNKLMMQEIRGRQAMGKIIQKNTDDTGVVNPKNALRDISQDPDASWMYLKEQDAMKNANPLTDYVGTNAQGQPTPAKAPLYNIPGIFPGQPPRNEAQKFPPTNTNPDAPQLSQEEVDKLHAHNQGMIKVLQPLANDPSLDHKKVIRGVADLVADPAVQFNAMDGASALSDIPFGEDGALPDPNVLREKLTGIVDQQKQHEAALQERYPSSEQMAARNAQMRQNPLELTGPGVATGVPEGYSNALPKSRDTYNQVTEEAETVPQRVYAYNEIINLANSGAPSGTTVSKMWQWAARNVPGAPQGISDKAAQAQELSKFMSQALLGNGMPASDSRLQELQSGNLNPEQLIETIKNLAPAFKAVAKGAVEKQKFYNRVTNNGSDLNNEPQAAQQWNANFDPRWVEFDQLNDKKEQRKFLAKHPDLLDKRDNYHALQEMGVVKK